jgi:hypothetical protein
MSTRAREEHRTGSHRAMRMERIDIRFRVRRVCRRDPGGDFRAGGQHAGPQDRRIRPPRAAPDFSLKGSMAASSSSRATAAKSSRWDSVTRRVRRLSDDTLPARQARDKLGPARKDFQVVYVTVRSRTRMTSSICASSSARSIRHSSERRAPASIGRRAQRIRCSGVTQAACGQSWRISDPSFGVRLSDRPKREHPAR